MVNVARELSLALLALADALPLQSFALVGATCMLLCQTTQREISEDYIYRREIEERPLSPPDWLDDGSSDSDAGYPFWLDEAFLEA